MPSEVGTECTSAGGIGAAAVADSMSSPSGVSVRARVLSAGRTEQLQARRNSHGGWHRLEVAPCKPPWTGSSASSRAAARLVLVVWIALVVISRPVRRRGRPRTSPAAASRSRARARRSSPTRSTRDFPGVAVRGRSSFVFDNREGDRSALAAAFDRVEREGFEGRRGRPAGPRGARAGRARRHGEAVDPDAARGHRQPRRGGRRRGRRCARTPSIDAEGDDAVSRCTSSASSALWAGMQELSKEDLEQAEIIGLPIVLIVLLAVFGSLAAAALPLGARRRRRGRHRRDRLLPLAGLRDVDLRDQHGLDARHRRGGGLLAVHPRPLPRGAARRAARRTRRARSRCGPPGWRWRSPA